MTTLTLFETEQTLIGFCCEGHSGYAASGEDIVCAAISALTQFCVSYLEKYNIGHTVDICERDARIECRLTEPNESFSKMLEVLRDSARDLQQTYPKFIRLEIMEVF